MNPTDLEFARNLLARIDARRLAERAASYRAALSHAAPALGDNQLRLFVALLGLPCTTGYYGISAAWINQAAGRKPDRDGKSPWIFHSLPQLRHYGMLRTRKRENASGVWLVPFPTNWNWRNILLGGGSCPPKCWNRVEDWNEIATKRPDRVPFPLRPILDVAFPEGFPLHYDPSFLEFLGQKAVDDPITKKVHQENTLLPPRFDQLPKQLQQIVEAKRAHAKAS